MKTPSASNSSSPKSSALVLPDLDRVHTIEDLDFDVIERRYLQYRKLANRRLILLGIKKAFEQIPDLQLVTACLHLAGRFATLKEAIGSNPDPLSYWENLGSPKRSKMPGYALDHQFNKLFAQVRSRLGSQSDALYALGSMIQFNQEAMGFGQPTRRMSMTRANHLYLIEDLLRVPDPSDPFCSDIELPCWNAASVAKADAAVMDHATPPATTPGKQHRL